MAGRRLSPEESDQLIELYTPLVRSVALSLVRKLPKSVELDDLLQDGYIGLLSALLQSTRNNAEGQFRSYLEQRVRGAMIDGLREVAPSTRRVRREMRRVEKVISELCNKLGRQPSEREVAARLSVPVAEYQQLLQEANDYTLLSLEDFDCAEEPESDFIGWCAATGCDPVAALQRRALQRRLLVAISDLSERESTVLTAYYVEDLTMSAIGNRLGVTEGRVSQIRTQAIARLRAAVLVDNKPSLLHPRRRVDVSGQPTSVSIAD